MTNNKNKVVNIQKFNPKQTHEFTKEEMPYTQICNKVIEECMNPVAGFIWIYLQSKPPTWKPCKWEIIKRFDISERTYFRHMKYLVSTNLIETFSIRDEDGKVVEWCIRVLNGSRFNPDADDYKGVTYALHTNQTAKNGSVDEPAPDKGFSQTAKNGSVDEKPDCQKSTSSDLAEYINTRSTSLVKKKKKIPPISPSGGSQSHSFSLPEMLKDNPFNIPESVLRDWLDVRKTKRAKMTSTAWTQANINLRKLQEAGLVPLDCFLKAVANGWAGVEFRYFERDIEALKAKPRYPTADERAANELKIREREMKAQADKQAEIQSSGGFMKQMKQHVSVLEAARQQEEHRKSLGLSVVEYHEQIILGKNKDRVPEDVV